MAFRLQLWSPMSGHAITLEGVKRNGCDDVENKGPQIAHHGNRNNYGQETHLWTQLRSLAIRP